MANNICMSFDIDDDDYDYQSFIHDLRQNLTHPESHGVPVLMPQSEPLSWLDIRLISGDHSIIVRMDRRDLYVLGYSTNCGIDFWEFSDSQLIPGSRSLRYSCSYVRAYGVQRGADVRRALLWQGYPLLQNAIRNLAVMTNPDEEQQQSAIYLLTIIQMTAEAARIKSIAEIISENWFPPQPITEEMEGTEKARAVTQSSSGTATQSSLGSFTPSSSLPGYNRTLVNINYVRVNHIYGKERGQLYGTVIVKDCWGDHTLYDRSSDNPERKRPGDYASLTSPSTAIAADDAFIIRVSLWDHDRFSRDHEIAKGEIAWDPATEETSYDKNLEELVSGQFGSVSVGYCIIRAALSATIKVVMINVDEGWPAYALATIQASGVLGGSSTTRMLFNEFVEVSPQQPIPLNRPVFPVPLDSDLTIAVALRKDRLLHALWKDRLSHDDLITLGSVKFTPVVGTQEKTITGKFGSVQVSITCE